MDAPDVAPCRMNRWLFGPVALAALAAVALAVFQTRTAWFREMDVRGDWHRMVFQSSAVLLPLSFLLFAFGVQWALRRQRALAAVALLPLPAWTACLLWTEGLLSNYCWFALGGLQMQGITPFGAQ